MPSDRQPTREAPSRAVIVALQLPGCDDIRHAASIAEIRRLLETLGHEVVGVVSQRLQRVLASTVIGQGKLLELARYTGGTGVVPSAAKPRKGRGGKDDARVEDDDGGDDDDGGEDDDRGEDGDRGDGGARGGRPQADLVVVDHDISPRQARNLEKATSARVLDRSGVIVEIFHRHASTREARLQVEMARLAYVVPRLRAGATGHDRQRGGVGGRGAGESSLELDRRKVRDRIAELRAELADLEREDGTRRERRREQRLAALVGYTNAGKSSFMRALTSSAVLVEDKLFATLGTTVRALRPEVRPRILVSDTVGFIERLPHELVASFRSTLAEALAASLLVQVVDCSDPSFAAQMQVTREVLCEIGADAVPSLLVLNKIDRVEPAARRDLAAAFPEALLLSAHDARDVAALHQAMVDFFERDLAAVELFVPFTKGAVVGEVRRAMRVVAERHDEHGTHFTVKAAPGQLARVRAMLA